MKPSDPFAADNLAFFATCPKGLEPLLAQELAALGAAEVKETAAGVHFRGRLALAYRACLWSRLASRVLLPLARFPAADAAALYEGVKGIEWQEHLDPDGSLRVDFTGTAPGLTHTHFGAQKVKDAVVDQLRERTGRRPSVDREHPDLRIHVRLHGGEAAVSLDLSGDSLHRRGYRLEGGAAPLKENLAAAILLRAGWPEIARASGPLLDPMCGSGTFLIEGAWMAADVAPGLLRPGFGFTGWRQHRQSIWRELRAEAEARRAEGLERGLPDIRGFDADSDAVAAARVHVERAGLAGRVRVATRELARLTRPPFHEKAPGLVVANPPYGERLGDTAALEGLYRHLGTRLRAEFAGWQAAVFTGNPELGKCMGLRAHKHYALYNGALPCRLLLFHVTPEWFVNRPLEEPAPAATTAVPDEPLPADPGSGPAMLANRLRKDLRTIGKWARREGIECYRLYDADMKEYAVAVDLYRDWAHVQEYAPPATVDPDKAGRRLREALQVVSAVLEIPPERVVLKQRRRQKGPDQYRKMGERGRFLEVEEHGARFLVNLTDYLDTGLFLDARPVRRLVRESAKGARFLNMFCYTATATVAAALGGAGHTTSVDLSPTYLHWARRNLALNGLAENRHRLVRADCLEWLEACREHFDLVLLDPPTFSNSKRTEGVLDVQRDHVGLIRAAVQRLAPGGRLIFSTNFRRFRLDEAALAGLAVRDISRATLDKDFERDPRIHRCWEIRTEAKP